MSPSDDIFIPFLRRFTNEPKRSRNEMLSLHKRVTERHRREIWSRPDAIKRASTLITELVAEQVELPTYPPLVQGIDDCQRELLALETHIFAPIDTDLGQPLSLRGRVELNAKLRAQDYFLEHQDEVLDILADAIGELSRAVIENAGPVTASPLTVPLVAMIEGPGAFLDGVIGIFLRQEHLDRNLFSTLNQVLYQNLCAASGVSADAELTKPLVWPSGAKMEPDQLLDRYLAGTPLHALFSLPVPFAIPEEQRFAGHWIIAPPGRGKTTLLHALVIEDFAKDASVILMDSKGDLIDPIRNLKAVEDRLLLIEPNPDAAFALNPLDVSHASIVQVVSLIEYIMAGLLDAKFTALQSTLFRNVVPAIVEAVPSPTLDTFKEVMVRGLPNLDRVNPHARQFFENRETGFHSKTYESTRKEVVWRLDYLMSNPTLRSMFSATHTKLDMGGQMDSGKIIVINNSKAILGDEGAEFFGRFFIALIARAAQQRSGKPATSKKPCYVYIDECQSVIAKDTRIPTLLDECRSQKIALILVHQRTAQLTGPVLDAVANCAIRMANSDDEAKYLSAKLRMDTEVLQSLPRGTFGTFVRDLTPTGIQLKISKVDLDALPKMSVGELDAISSRMKAQFSSPPPAAPQPDESAPRPAQAKAQRSGPQAPAVPADASEVGNSAGTPDPGEPTDQW